MLSKTFVLLGALAAVASAAPKCRPSSTSTGTVPSPTLPSSGGATDLPLPPAGITLKYIAAGHGIQNYTCATADTEKAVADGALAVLYDITPLYPGTPNTGLSVAAFNALPTTILWSQPLPLNMQNTSAASSGTPSDPNVMPESAYGAVVGNPFPAPAALVLDGMDPIAYLGHHFFDSLNGPTFDLRESHGIFGRVGNKVAVPAPSGADLGVLGTGAVDWLRLSDDGTGVSDGMWGVFRVVTAGGAAQACADSGAGSGSVPYTAMYWIFG